MDPRYDHIKSEQEAQKLWEEQQTYAFSKLKTKEIFSIDTPPPTVSGTLHIGHVFSYTHADIIARYKRMQNYNVFYPMGFDDNGLATERFVEKKNKTKSHLMKRSDFIALCLKEVAEAEEQFIKLWKSIGLSVDWNHVYTTISDPVKKISQYSFLELYKKNYVYRQHEPALYCTTCRTSVAQAEIDNIEVSSTFNDIEFQTEDGQKLIIATTRPELLPACVAIFYHPEDTRYIHLHGKFAITPVFNKKVPILPDAKVTPEKGSGLVMCCTFGDQTDVYWYKMHKLPFIQVVGFDGKWTKEAGILEGLTVHDARKKTIELLTQAGKLLSQKAITHAVNAHERCKNEIEYLILSQWFIKILEHKEKFLELANKINWKPAFMQARYRDWVEHLNWDWCISRQLSAGIPFPAWHCQDCDHIIFAQVQDLPVDPREQACPESICPKCSSTNIRPDTDIMDTWNTSALTPQINIGWPDHINPEEAWPTIPMSMRPQAHDIIRTWAFYTIIKAYYHHDKLPWENIVISGHVLAGKEKISKSKGNEKMT
ncbi:MAG: valine--tRNA ligase, partial [bacterium]